ncbi:MAG: oxidoreductase, partial [Planctomycetaceae bacterium]
MDQHLSMCARAAGAETLEQTVPGEAHFDPFSSEWTIRLSSGQPGESAEAVVRSRWLVDATGAGQAVSQQVG